ncbi:MAG: hypothetical protein K2Y32_10530 [Candidatus Obscuribacterales bacterium]|nr:hypothetical protein [Candidatus Obscuribacterales bacterium]
MNTVKQGASSGGAHFPFLPVSLSSAALFSALVLSASLFFGFLAPPVQAAQPSSPDLSQSQTQAQTQAHLRRLQYNRLASQAQELASLRYRVADVEKSLSALNTRNQGAAVDSWSKSDRRSYESLHKKLVALKAQHNQLAESYNSFMAANGYPFTDRHDLPRGASVVLLRQVMPLTDVKHFLLN